VSISSISPKTAVFGGISVKDLKFLFFDLNIFAPVSKAEPPDMRMTAIPPAPLGVAIAAIVSAFSLNTPSCNFTFKKKISHIFLVVYKKY